jgi:hypothetical protein
VDIQNLFIMMKALGDKINQEKQEHGILALGY